MTKQKVTITVRAYPKGGSPEHEKQLDPFQSIEDFILHFAHADHNISYWKVQIDKNPKKGDWWDSIRNHKGHHIKGDCVSVGLLALLSVLPGFIYQWSPDEKRFIKLYQYSEGEQVWVKSCNCKGDLFYGGSGLIGAHVFINDKIPVYTVTSRDDIEPYFKPGDYVQADAITSVCAIEGFIVRKRTETGGIFYEVEGKNESLCVRADLLRKVQPGLEKAYFTAMAKHWWAGKLKKEYDPVSQYPEREMQEYALGMLYGETTGMITAMMAVGYTKAGVDLLKFKAEQAAHKAFIDAE